MAWDPRTLEYIQSIAKERGIPVEMLMGPKVGAPPPEFVAAQDADAAETQAAKRQAAVQAGLQMIVSRRFAPTQGTVPINDNVRRYLERMQAAKASTIDPMEAFGRANTIQKADLDARKAGAEIGRIGAETGKIGAEVGKIGAETAEISGEASQATRDAANRLGYDLPPGTTEKNARSVVETLLKERSQNQDAYSLASDPVYGGFVRLEKKSGAISQVPPGGVQAGDRKGPIGIKMTEPQAKAFSAVSRIREARKMMEEAGYPEGVKGRWDAAATGAGRGSSFVPQEAATQKGQQYFTAARNLIAALLRKESGAAITKDEWQELGPLYVPMPWDSATTRDNKLKMLDTMEQSATTEAGPAAAAHLSAPAAPAASAPEPGGKVRMTDPSGAAFDVDASEAAEAEAHGWKRN